MVGAEVFAEVTVVVLFEEGFVFVVEVVPVVFVVVEEVVV
jgi:hypothetical protein